MARKALVVAVVHMEATATTRVDKWLWGVRLFKTRSLATEACNAGRVQVNGQPAKPARAVRPGDTIIAFVHNITRTVKVLAVLEKRIGAKLVSIYVEDLTPPAEFQKAREKLTASAGQRDKGAGRPTKRDRRILSSFFGEE
jgi:ribosome-associated heat shock protein Hsp15